VWKGGEPLDGVAVPQGLDLGGETGNAEDALKSGEEFSLQTPADV
jgi:hypothetical protein